MKCRQSGLSWLEFMVVSAILAIFAGVLLERLSYYQEVAEKMNMEATAVTLRSALLLEVAGYMTSGQKIDYERLAQENPMDWLDVKPPNYAGAFNGLPDALQRGNWYFDKAERVLVYEVNQGRYFMPDSRGLKQVRYRVELVNGDVYNSKGLGASLAPISGIRLTTIEPYRWFSP